MMDWNNLVVTRSLFYTLFHSFYICLICFYLNIHTNVRTVQCQTRPDVASRHISQLPYLVENLISWSWWSDQLINWSSDQLIMMICWSSADDLLIMIWSVDHHLISLFPGFNLGFSNCIISLFILFLFCTARLHFNFLFTFIVDIK